MRTLISLFFTLFFAFPVRSQTIGMPTSPLRARLVEAAEKYVGIREATGNNDGAEVKKILKNVGLKEGYAWCAALQAIIHDDINLVNPHSAYCPDWFRSNVVYKKSLETFDKFQAKRGQVFGLWITNKGRVGHVGMLIGETKFSYTTIEGNTNGDGSDEGDGCYQKIRNKRSIYVVADYAMSREEKREYLGKGRKLVLKDIE